MPLPWETYREHVARAVANVVASHKPDHGHEGALHNETAYGLRPNGDVAHRINLDSVKSSDDLKRKDIADPNLKNWLEEQTAGLSGKDFSTKIETLKSEHSVRRVRVIERLSVIRMRGPAGSERHGTDDAGEPLAYKGYKGDSNYCIEISRGENGKWKGTVISTFEAHEIVRSQGRNRLRDPTLAQDGSSLVMRLMNSDTVRLELDGVERTLTVANISGNGQVFMADHQEANVDARNRDASSGFKYISKMAGSFRTAKARRVTVSAIGDLRDPGFID